MSNFERINEASKNPKRLWTTIKSILHSSPPPSNEQLSPPISRSLANSLASFFYQKIVSLKDSIALKLQGSPTPFDFDLPHSGEVLSDFTPVTPAEVSQLLRSMSNKLSPLDYIPTSLLKSCADTFSIRISHLANLSFTQATFPSNFKLALISPLLKKPGLPKSDLANFRPISNLNTMGKILERLAALALSRFFPHISKSPSFSPLQSAYRKFHSTETALLKLTNYILETISSGKNYNSNCFGYVRSLWYSGPHYTSSYTSAYFRSIWLCYLLDLFVSNWPLILCKNWFVILTFHHHTHRRASGLCFRSTTFRPFHITNCKCHKFWSVKPK